VAQVLKKEIRARIDQAALNEFFNKGYKFATMKNIAARSGVPTGLIYSYYRNKEDLFNHIVEPVAALIDSAKRDPDPSDDSSDNLFNHELPRLMRCVNHYHKQLVILVDKSMGSPFAQTKERIIDDVALHLRQTPALRDTSYDDVFYHIQATNFMEGIFEIARHYVDQTWADKMINLLVQQHLYGVRGLSQ
jgi:AcrR family transcriptional regulator